MIVTQGSSFFGFLHLSYKLPQNANLLILMFIEVKAMLLPLLDLRQVIIKSFLGETDHLGCTVQSIGSFTIRVNSLIEFSPVIDIIHRLSDGSFLDFPLGLGSIGYCPCLSLLVLSCYAPISNLDCAVEEKFIFEIDDLFEREEAHMDIDFAGKIQVEEIAVVEVETFIREGVTGGTDR